VQLTFQYPNCRPGVCILATLPPVYLHLSQKIYMDATVVTTTAVATTTFVAATTAVATTTLVLGVRAQNELLYLISSARRYESQRDAGLDHPRDGRAALRRGSSLQAADKATSAMILCHRGCWMVIGVDGRLGVRLVLDCRISAMICVHRLDLGPASTGAAQRVTGHTVLTRG
jgi:hypothetical protein